jgi:RNA polymerase sigma factor (sigma-70 family)
VDAVVSPTAQLQGCLDRLRQGEGTARDDLVRHACTRLERLTRKLLKSYPGVQRWAQTDDVLQNALIRLLAALQDVHPESVRDFYALSSLQIRRELLDLARHYFGPRGMGANHASRLGDESSHDPLAQMPERSSCAREALWCELQEHIGTLASEEREIVNLLYYQELPQAEAAAVLNISLRTLQRRWQTIILKLHRRLGGKMPEL